MPVRCTEWIQSRTVMQKNPGFNREAGSRPGIQRNAGSFVAEGSAPRNRQVSWNLIDVPRSTIRPDATRFRGSIWQDRVKTIGIMRMSALPCYRQPTFRPGSIVQYEPTQGSTTPHNLIPPQASSNCVMPINCPGFTIAAVL